MYSLLVARLDLIISLSFLVILISFNSQLATMSGDHRSLVPALCGLIAGILYSAPYTLLEEAKPMSRLASLVPVVGKFLDAPFQVITDVPLVAPQQQQRHGQRVGNNPPEMNPEQVQAAIRAAMEQVQQGQMARSVQRGVEGAAGGQEGAQGGPGTHQTLTPQEAQLTGMGFPLISVRQVLRAVNNNVDEAIGILLSQGN